MQELGHTVLVQEPVYPTGGASGEMLVTVFDGLNPPVVWSLNQFRKPVITFGRQPENDIVLGSPIISGMHGRFRLDNGQWIIEDKFAYNIDQNGEHKGSLNGLIYNDLPIVSRALCDGDFIRIDNNEQTISTGVLFVFSGQGQDHNWSTLPLGDRWEIRIGRDQGCDIVLPHISVSRVHATIRWEDGQYYIVDNGSTNGVVVNNRRIIGKQRLEEKDVIAITNSKLIFTSAAISYCCYKNGISVDVADVVIVRGKGRKSRVTGDHVSLNIRPGELVSIVGGSGAGKSTILDCMCGYLPPAAGEVFVNGVSLYQNFDSLKKLIGYVPQSDIVYDNLTLYDMLSYTAKLRLSKDTSRQEREAAIDRAIQLVNLPEKRNSFIKSLSGGQKKRASIAVELLSDPNLLFLDEPASGLDPGTELSLMRSLREMANNGKTVILVTHSTLQLELCDKIIFMGKDGRLCFFGSYNEALRFFGVSNIVDVYDMLSDADMAETWRTTYDYTKPWIGPSRAEAGSAPSSKKEKKFQLPVLCSRYIKLVANDRQRLLLLLLQAPLLALLISLVADGNQFEQYEMTKSLLFALSCSAFWVGMLNAIQEVCKERKILKREYMTGLSLSGYILSKILVLGVLCLIQSLFIIVVFAIAVGVPDEGLFIPSVLELLLTTFLTAVASTAMGLFVSSLFKNADRAMTVAPILLMPQILFSGLIFKLDGATEIISWFAVCRWSMEGYGTTANLNDLPQKLQLQGFPIPREAESFFDFTVPHIFQAWSILVLFTFVFLVLAGIILSRIGKAES